jgi:hypothetical protein
MSEVILETERLILRRLIASDDEGKILNSNILLYNTNTLEYFY